MKKLSIFTILFLSAFLFQTGLIYAQSGDDVFSFMEEYLTGDEASQIDRAKSSISKADKLSSSIRTEDKKIEKYLKKKKKKAEKKSVDVKILRIKQALYYDKGYSLVYNVYNEKIGESTFLYGDDEARVNNLLEKQSSFIRGEEGFSSTAYPDGNNFSIGFGMQTFQGKPVTEGMTITRDQAKTEFARQLPTYMTWTDAYPNLDLSGVNANTRTALTSFTYNLGPHIWKTPGGAKILENIANGEKQAAADGMMKFVYGRLGKGKPKQKFPALVKRRRREAALLLA